MLQFLYAVGLIVSLGWSQLTATSQEVEAALARAQSLYYDARFVESIAELAPVDAALQSKPELTDQKIKVKLFLALANIGLNDIGKAKSFFKEVCALDSDYTLAPTQFSSKVVSVFEEAKAEQNESSCRKVCAELDSRLSAGDITAFVERLDSVQANCSCVKAAVLDAAELSYKEGVKSYQDNDFTDALQKLRTALKLHPDHELAAQYVELTQNKLRLAADRVLLQWRNSFEAQEFVTAAATYRQLQAANVEDTATNQLGQMRTEYRRFLSGLVEPWMQACQKGDLATLATIRTQTTELLPDRAIGQDIVDQMKCAHQKDCIWQDGALAMPRVTASAAPTIPENLRRVVETSSPLTVYAQVQIDESGNVRVIETQGAQPGIREAVRTAVGKWKFSPARINDEIRCVDTILPIVIKR